MPEEPPHVHDPRVLRAIAHPVRNRILEELSAGGPQRAADMAAVLGVPANQASFHLRQLAKYGLVVEAPEAARDGRDRVWKAAHESGLTIDLNELAATPGGKAAATVYRREAAAAARDAVDRAYGAERQPDSTVVISDSALRLTRADARALAAELEALVESWRQRGQHSGPDARTYQLLQILQPMREA
ncbi:helix-turn-helix domain-containing protein [Nocardioides sp.]|uniref:helix-turn-helix domain-containing protein n=1 Tax=Nocardioides sp. TaxID=35761 RepID=UPI003D0C0C7C